MELTEVLLVLSTGSICLLAFYFGSILGRGEQIPNKEINMPNPLKIYREHQDKKEAQKEQERIDIIMQNIDSYDGTANGQKDIPG